MAHDPRCRGGVHAAELLDRLHDKKQQDQAYNEIHSCKAFDRTPASGALPLRTELPPKAKLRQVHVPRICDNRSRAAESASASRTNAAWPPAA